jgi:sec-independent protein translocase protein TatA
MMPGPSELILILLVVVLVFGPKRIPEIMKGLGDGIKTFKKEMDSTEQAITAAPKASEISENKPALMPSSSVGTDEAKSRPSD